MGGHYLGGKSATGLMEWPDVESALEVYVIANHYTMHSLSECHPIIIQEEIFCEFFLQQAEHIRLSLPSLQTPASTHPTCNIELFEMSYL